MLSWAMLSFGHRHVWDIKTVEYNKNLFMVIIKFCKNGQEALCFACMHAMLGLNNFVENEIAIP